MITDDQPFWKTEAVPKLVEQQREILNELISTPVDPMGDLEAWETVQILAPQWERQRYLLQSRVAVADAKYLELLGQAANENSSTGGQRYYGLTLLMMLMSGMFVLIYRGQGKT